ncbi:auxin-responsive protein SAUR66-like [Gossypium australe]|uniref:Auxin-responsive protein SAUR66-like n=1 Tax=Gossypium australe TaxID=47621 RepID=A0A5B6VA65_9ROSI|nr:auxin-responsive protein SAUR66-like [Gossypium australe]
MTVKGRKSLFTGDIQCKSGVNESPVAENDHFVIYTADQKRHHVPLSYLSNNIFVELLKLFGGRVWSIKSWSYNVAL